MTEGLRLVSGEGADQEARCDVRSGLVLAGLQKIVQLAQNLKVVLF